MLLGTAMISVSVHRNSVAKTVLNHLQLSAPIVRAILGNGVGVVGAQLISFASMAAVARLYAPADLGHLGLFMSLIAVLTPLGTLSYPNAICYAPSRGHSIAVAVLGLIGALALSLLICVLGGVASILGTQSAVFAQSAVLGLGIVASALMAISTQLTFRARLIRIRSTVLVAVAAVVALVRLIIGWYAPSSIGLVGSAILGFLLTSFLLLGFGLRVNLPRLARVLAKAPLRHCARHYENFPRYSMPHALVRYGTIAAPTVVFGAVSGPALAGQYTLAAAVVSAPLLMIADAVGDAIARPLAQRAEINRREALRLALRLSGALGALLVPVLLLFLMDPQWVIRVAFGSGWELSGDFARLLLLWTSGMLITRPLICLVPVMSMQNLLLRNELWFGVLRTAGLFSGLLLLDSSFLAVAGFALPGVALSLINALQVVRAVAREGSAS